MAIYSATQLDPHPVHPLLVQPMFISKQMNNPTQKAAIITALQTSIQQLNLQIQYNSENIDPRVKKIEVIAPQPNMLQLYDYDYDDDKGPSRSIYKGPRDTGTSGQEFALLPYLAINLKSQKKNEEIQLIPTQLESIPNKMTQIEKKIKHLQEALLRTNTYEDPFFVQDPALFKLMQLQMKLLKNELESLKTQELSLIEKFNKLTKGRNYGLLHQ